MDSRPTVLETVKEYYGKKLTATSDLKVQASVCPRTPGQCPLVRQAIADVHEDVQKRFFGCGSAIPEKLEGMRVLDLGCGNGRDSFAVSKLVGQDGHVTGIDMTDELIDDGMKYIPYHTEKFGYKSPNVTCVKGYIEKLTDAGIQENSLDIIISNCVINLSPDKPSVCSETVKVLKVGGELYFSDMYADRLVPDRIKSQAMLWGEGFGGALWWRDVYRLAKEVGLSTPRLVAARHIPVDREDFKQIIGDVNYASVTYRMFKLPENVTRGCYVTYKGTIPGKEEQFALDHRCTFKAGKPVEVDSELATILSSSRFKDDFQFLQDEDTTASRDPVEVEVTDPFQFIGLAKN